MNRRHEHERPPRAAAHQPVASGGAAHRVTSRAAAMASRADVDVRVLVHAERHDEEEKEPGYGYGV